MNMQEMYFAKMSSNFRRWDADMGQLAGKGAEMEESERAGYEQQLRTMRARRDSAYRKLQEIRSASESNWRRLQGALDASWSSLRHAMQRANAQSRGRA